MLTPDRFQMISPHFSYKEAVTTNHALSSPNTPTNIAILDNIATVAGKMEIVRNLLGNTGIHINSWYRNLELNRALGSKDTSDHLKGCAVDFTCPDFGTPVEICKHLILYQDQLGFKQLILEHTWVHISWDTIPNTLPKLQVLSLLNGGTYAIGLTDPTGKFYS